MCDEPTGAAGRSRGLGVGAALLVGAVALLVRIPVLWLPPSCDEALYATVGAVWFRHGGLPYADALENKPPGVFAVYGASRAALGSAFGGPRMAAAACAAATAVLLALLAAQLSGRAAGVLGGLAFALLSAAVYTPMAYCEAFMLPFGVGAVFLAFRSLRGGGRWAVEALGAGLCAGVALTFKQVALAEALAIALAFALCGRGRAVRLALLVSGLALFPALWASYFAAHGVLREAYEGAVGLVGTSATVRVGALVIPWVREAGRLLAATSPLIVGTVIAAAGPLWRVGRPAAILHLAWLGLVSLAALGALRFAPHQLLQALPPVCVLGSVGLVAAWRWTAGRVSRRAAGAVLGALVVAFIGLAGLQAPRYARVLRHAFREDPLDAELRRAGELIRRRTGPGERVYVAGLHTHLHVYADRAPAARVFNVIFTVIPGYRQEALEVLRRAPPAYIQIEPRRLGGARISMEELEAVMHERYRRIMQDDLQHIELYERLDLGPPAGTDGEGGAERDDRR